jgi:uridine kinase
LDPFVAALADRIDSIAHPGNRALVAIDGRGGSGKSTIADGIVELLVPRAAVLRVDNFFKPLAEWRPQFGRSIPHLRWEDFHAVLTALRAGETARYRPYDWRNDRLGGEVQVRADIVVVEGLYAMKKGAHPLYGLTMWVEADIDSRMERVVARDGTEFLDRWNREYLPLERDYIEDEAPWRQADIVIAGANMPLSALGAQLLAANAAI